jgi:hypothetical protein
MQSLGLQIVSLAGALLILVAYVGHQLKWMRPEGVTYNLMNAAGSGILAYVAFRPFQVGFVVMETAWVVISLYALLRSRRAEPADGRA